MISSTAAETIIRGHLTRFASEQRPIDQLAGAVLRQSIVAERDQPPFDRVSMDGIAIRFEDFSAGTRAFTPFGTQLAGMPPLSLEHAGGCIEVMTGAVIPAGCDTVIAIEQTRRDGSQYLLPQDQPPQRGQFIHRRGSDCVRGEVLIESGARLRAPHLAILAANGYSHAKVTREPGIAILATGDELVDVDATVAPWQIRRSNDHALAAMLVGAGLREVRLQPVADEPAALRAAIDAQLRSRDVLILSGGVSMGQRDYVPDVLRELGVRCVFHKIAQRPGKPMWFGIGAQGQAVFALPGNPVSVLVCAARYVVPALLDAAGLLRPTTVTAALVSPLIPHASLTRFVPVRLRHDADGRRLAVPCPAPTSGDFSHLAETDGIVELPPGDASVPAGFRADYYPW